MMMTDNAKLPAYITSRFRWLMLARVVIVTFLLGLATFIDIKGMESLSAVSASTLFKTILLTYVLSIIFLFLSKYISNISLNIYIQSICDVALITGMVYATGGIHSIYSVFYPLVIIYSVLFVGRRGGNIIASVAGIFYGLFADLEFYGVIYPLFSVDAPDYRLNAGYVITRIITHILSFYIIAFLTSFVVEQEKKARVLLAEKQSAFDQLDLLHKSIIESVDTGILTVNPEGLIKSFNRAAADITGYLFREVENCLISDLFPDCRAFSEEHDGDGTRSPAKTRFEMTFQCRDGRASLLGGSISPLRDPQGVTIGSIIIFQDLTAINAMKESLEKSRRLAFVGEMAAGLAHEIRNPLASISGSIQMLKGDLYRNEMDERLMQIVLRGKDQLESFLNDFLLIARPARGAREELDVRETTRDVIESIRCVPEWNESTVVRMVFPDTPLYILANKKEIRQVIWNLILNAVQSMPEGGILTIDAHPRQNQDREGAEIEIQDTGCGIEEKGLTKIFEPFYTTRDTGTGLGLTVVSRILEEYKGTIRIDSASGKGTICRIWFPYLGRQLVENVSLS
jgi:two-component system, NtrC family, sensor histidine kinase PilS